MITGKYGLLENPFIKATFFLYACMIQLISEEIKLFLSSLQNKRVQALDLCYAFSEPITDLEFNSPLWKSAIKFKKDKTDRVFSEITQKIYREYATRIFLIQAIEFYSKDKCFAKLHI